MNLESCIYLADRWSIGNSVWFLTDFDYPVNRDVGTVNEQAVTIVSFNRNNGRVLLRRIGAVTPNMTTEYNYLSAN